MFKKILVPTDGSPLADKAVHAAVEFARQSKAAIVGITVVEPYSAAPVFDSAHSGGYEAFRQRQQEVAQYRLSRIHSAASLCGVQCETVVAESASPHREIVDAAQRLGCDAIFMASHGRSAIAQVVLGSETQKVLAATTIPVMVYR